MLLGTHAAPSNFAGDGSKCSAGTMHPRAPCWEHKAGLGRTSAG